MSYFMYNTTWQEKRRQITPVVEELPTIMENWDNDNSGTYDPTEHAEKNIVLRCLIRASKAKKREFRKMERLRIQKLLECQLPFVNNLKQLSLEDDSIWEKISHLCKLAIQDRLITEEEIQQEFVKMKISFS